MNKASDFKVGDTVRDTDIVGLAKVVGVSDATVTVVFFGDGETGQPFIFDEGVDLDFLEKIND